MISFEGQENKQALDLVVDTIGKKNSKTLQILVSHKNSL